MAQSSIVKPKVYPSEYACALRKGQHISFELQFGTRVMTEVMTETCWTPPYTYTRGRIDDRPPRDNVYHYTHDHPGAFTFHW